MIVKAVGLLADPPATPLPLPRKVRQAASHPSSSSWSLPRLEKAGQIHEQRREFLDNANTETLEMHREKKKRVFFFRLLIYTHTHPLESHGLGCPSPSFPTSPLHRLQTPSSQVTEPSGIPVSAVPMATGCCVSANGISVSVSVVQVAAQEQKEGVRASCTSCSFFFSCTGMINRRRRRHPPAPPLACCRASEGSSWTRVM